MLSRGEKTSKMRFPRLSRSAPSIIGSIKKVNDAFSAPFAFSPKTVHSLSI
ncbi:hypothetical protein HMPREF0388_1838 [Mobiluncus curtisii ATCC 51333]|uniref:Uncharacterized protein n=1 Tax=Mobiluncus curtisii ATCC 51333 TaxID=887326 RepID=E6LZX5_9ACTO|nr:hypothetical protein HMPREF0388_1838 [Mobiluncus curtisii ATCC 51333]